MDYKTSKELLLFPKELKEKEAEEILNMWQGNPRAYHDLLRNQGAAERLKAYVGVDREELMHEFIPINTVVPAISIAEKFFSLRDDDISEGLLSLVDYLSIDGVKDNVCAWPYLTISCVKHLSKETLEKVINNPYYVFDFSNDSRGDLFDTMFQSFSNVYMREMLAANSFNIMGWTNKAYKYSQQEFAKYLIMSEHYINEGIGEEAFFRKLYIRYRTDINLFKQKLDEELLKKQGYNLGEEFFS